jgi:hypothetical protein
MPVLERISGYLGNDQVLYQKIISSTSVEPFINSLREMFRDKMREYLAREGGGTDERYDLVSTEYLTSGVLGVYRSWLTGDFGDATADDVNRYLCGLVKVTCRAVRP